MKFVLIGSALSGNKGAAAMLESSIQSLSKGREDVSFTLLSMYPLSDSKLNTYKNLEVINASPLVLGVKINSLALMYRLLPFARNWLKVKSSTLKVIAEADVYLDQGGITFVDGREKFLIYNIASILPALMTGTPVVKCAQALGPFNNLINKSCAKLILPHVKCIISRGAITHKHLMSLGLTNVVAGADYAFSLELTQNEVESAESKYDKSFFKGGRVVGISPSAVMQKSVARSGKDYQQIIIDFINYLTLHDYKVVLVPHSVRTGTNKTHNNDMPLCKNIYEQLLTTDKVLFLDSELSSQELRYWIGKCNLFVASRFHAMVSSLAMEVPTLVIGWSHKYKEVLQMFDLEEWAFGKDKLSYDYLVEQFELLVRENKSITIKLRSHLPEVKRVSLRHAQYIIKSARK